jgi:hypothetical protein
MSRPTALAQSDIIKMRQLCEQGYSFQLAKQYFPHLKANVLKNLYQSAQNSLEKGETQPVAQVNSPAEESPNPKRASPEGEETPKKKPKEKENENEGG